MCSFGGGGNVQNLRQSRVRRLQGGGGGLHPPGVPQDLLHKYLKMQTEVCGNVIPVCLSAESLNHDE